MQTVTFPGRYENLEEISKLVVDSAKSAGMDEDSVYALQLAVDEACSNIIEHAYGGEGIGEIKVTIQPTQREFIVILRDRGQPFDPDQVPEPTRNVPLEEIEPRGVGLYLIRKMMDEVRFDFSSETGNVLTLVKRIKPS